MDIKDKLPSDFHPEMYKSLHKDIKTMTNAQAAAHYYHFGQKEGREYRMSVPPDFDPECYRIMNKDLSNMTDIQMMVHYYHCGQKEGREYRVCVPPDFDPECYRTMYHEFSNMTDIQTKVHYHMLGKKEGREYSIDLPPDFIPECYRTMNHELSNMTDIQAKVHYHMLGKKEGREYRVPNDFDFVFYKRLHPSLSGSTEEEIKIYYCQQYAQRQQQHDVCKMETIPNLYDYFNLYNVTPPIEEEGDLVQKTTEILLRIQEEKGVGGHLSLPGIYPEKDVKYLKEDHILSKIFHQKFQHVLGLAAFRDGMIHGYCWHTQRRVPCHSAILYDSDRQGTFNFILYQFEPGTKDEFYLCTAWEFFLPLFLYYPQQGRVYNINPRKGNEKLKELFIHLAPQFLNPSNIAELPPHVENRFTYAIGIINNAGHFLWNEVGGLSMLIELGLLDSVQQFDIYCFDFMGVGKILRDKYHKNVRFITPPHVGDLPLFFQKMFWSPADTDRILDFFDLSSSSSSCENGDECNLLFDIRSNRRRCLNEMELIQSSLDHLLQTEKFSQIHVHITGWYTTECPNSIITESSKKEIQTQHLFVERVMDFCQQHYSSASATITVHNHINKPLMDLLRTIRNFDLMVCNEGSGVNFFASMLFSSIPILYYTNTYAWDPFHEQILAQNNWSHVHFIPKDAITNHHDGDGDDHHHEFVDFTVDTHTFRLLFEKMLKY